MDERRADEFPLTTLESLIAAMVEAGPEVVEHLVKAASELALAAQALTNAAERRLAQQRRPQDVAARTGGARDREATPTGEPEPTRPIRRIDDVA
jgi:uncharacterized membrane-anchored protein YhcB (DUF1043 family)